MHTNKSTCSRISNNLNLNQRSLLRKRSNLHREQAASAIVSSAQTALNVERRERRLAYLHTSAHRIRRPNPLRPDRIYFAELLDVDDVDPSAHDLVEAGVGGLEARLDVADCLMLGESQLVEDVGKVRCCLGRNIQSALRSRLRRFCLSWDHRPSSLLCAGLRVIAGVWHESSCRWALGQRRSGRIGECRVGTFLVMENA